MKQRLLIVLLIVIGVSGLLFIVLQNNRTSISYKQKNFALNKSHNIDLLSIISTEDTLTLYRNDNTWFIDNEIPANPAMINATLALLKKLQMKYPVSKRKLKEYADLIRQKGTNISAYKRNTCVYNLKFLDIKGQTYAMNSYDIPFAVSVMGNEGLCLGSIIKPEKSKWTNNLLIDVDKTEIATIRLTYYNKGINGFKIDARQSTPILFDLNGNKIRDVQAENLVDYLSFYRGITFEGKYKLPVSRLIINPWFSLELTLRSGYKFLLQGNEILAENETGKDINIFAGIVNKSDTILLKYSVFDPIIVDLSYFLKK